ncbi:MAG: DUF222 domain-containing protein [Chloroflexi bacterium]|nr:MAG: DUF222 domain-containing protein [Chloroflexota bacterium]
MEKLRAAVAQLETEDPDFIDPRELSSLIDRQQAKLAEVVHRGAQRGHNTVEGKTVHGWVASTCRLSGSGASDRLRVGAQLEKLPRIAAALKSGEIGYQAASLVCRLSDQLGEKRNLMDEEQWVEYARSFSIDDLRRLTEHARYVADPDGAEKDNEENYEQRYLHLSELGGMYKLDGVLDREGGMALKTALESLSRRLGELDHRTPKQRRADALKEIIHHALDGGTLPRRNGARPHIAVHTTPDGLRGELGAGPGELANGAPISNKTVQRLACDSLMHRVLKADSLVVDVGRAHRTAQPAQWRGLRARHKTCAGPGCDRPASWTQAHHLDFWSRDGKTNLGRLLPLCYFHHRLLHEGGWQTVLAGGRVEFIPPETPVMIKRRWGERRWAA